MSKTLIPNSYASPSAVAWPIYMPSSRYEIYGCAVPVPVPTKTELEAAGRICIHDGRVGQGLRPEHL